MVLMPWWWHLHAKLRMAIFMECSGIWLSCDSHRVYVAITGSTWLLQGIQSNFSRNVWPCNSHIDPVIVLSYILKPEDSFGEFNNKNSWSSESAGNHQKIPSDLPGMTHCNAILPNDKLSLYMYITYGKVFGGTPNIFMVWLFPENEKKKNWL